MPATRCFATYARKLRGCTIRARFYSYRMASAADVRDALAEVAEPGDAEFLQRFFKTGPGQYGEGDVFIGVRVPATRAVVKRFRDLELAEIEALLDDLATSSSVWERRVAVLATFDFIKHGDAGPALRLSEALLGDRHDLIQKATGWMLREAGKRVSPEVLLGFLDAHAAQMPRTMLSYAIEHLTPEQRAHYRSR